MQIKVNGKTHDLEFRRGRYVYNDALAVAVIDKNLGPYCTLTVNLEDNLKTGFAFVDVNNCPSDVIKALEKQKLIKKTEIECQSGYVTYPLYEFSKEWLESLKEM